MSWEDASRPYEGGHVTIKGNRDVINEQSRDEVAYITENNRKLQSLTRTRFCPKYEENPCGRHDTVYTMQGTRTRLFNHYKGTNN